MADSINKNIDAAKDKAAGRSLLCTSGSSSTAFLSLETADAVKDKVEEKKAGAEHEAKGLVETVKEKAAEA